MSIPNNRSKKSTLESRSQNKRSRIAALSAATSAPIVDNEYSPETNTNQSSSDLSIEKDVKYFLKTHGYQYIRGIYVGEDSVGVLAYIKAKIMGHKVYIDLDVAYTDIKPSEKDLSVKQMVRVKTEKVDDNIRAEQCSAMDVCGTAYECNEGFCTLRRNDNTFEIEEEDFYITTKRSERIAFEKDPAMAYPIVKISEIMANNTEVLRNIISASNRWRAHSIKLYFERKMALKLAIDELNMIMNETDDVLDGSYKNILKKENEMKLIQSKMDINIPPLPHEEDEYETLMHELDNTTNLRENLIRDTSILENFTQVIDEVTIQLKSLYKDINDRYNS